MNMNKQYRKELAALRAEERQIARGVKTITHKCQKQIKALQREVSKESRYANKQLTNIAKRRAVLEGRLS